MILGFLAVGSIGFWVLLLLSAFVVSSLVDDDHPYCATLIALGTFALLALLGNLNPVALIRHHPHQAILAIPAYFAAGVLWCYVKWMLHVDGKSRKARAAVAAFEREMALYNDNVSKTEARIAELRSDRDSMVSSAKEDVGTDGRYGSRAAWNRDGAAMKMTDSIAEMEASVSLERSNLDSERWRSLRWKAHFSEAGLSGTGKPLVRENKTRIVAWMSYWPASMAWTLIDDPVRRTFLAIYDHIGGSLQRISDRRFAGIEESYKTHGGKAS